MTFSLMELIEDAFDYIDKRPERLSARDLDSARRSIEAILADWANEDVNIWKVSEGSTVTVASTNDYAIGTIGSPVIDVLNVSIRDSNNYDTMLDIVSQGEYQLLPRKTQTGKPTQYTVFRTNYGVSLKLYPLPDAVYTLIYHTLNYIGEPGTYDATLDLPRKFQPALKQGLAYHLGLRNRMKIGPNGEILEPGVSPEQLQDLRREYRDVYTRAKDADRERAPFYAIPRIC